MPNFGPRAARTQSGGQDLVAVGAQGLSSERRLGLEEEEEEEGLLPLPQGQATPAHQRHRHQQHQQHQKQLALPSGLRLELPASSLALAATGGAVAATDVPSPYGDPISPPSASFSSAEHQQRQQKEGAEEGGSSPASTASLSSGSPASAGSGATRSSTGSGGGDTAATSLSATSLSAFFPFGAVAGQQQQRRWRQEEENAQEQGREEAKGQSPVLSAAAAPIVGEAAAVPAPLTRSTSKMFLPHESSEFVSEEDAERIEEEVEDEDEECSSAEEEEVEAVAVGSPIPHVHHHHHHHHTPRSEEERSAARAARKAAKAAARGVAAVLQRAVSAPTPPPPAVDQVRVHSLTLRELSIVDESPPQLVAPRLSLPTEAGRVAQCRAAYGKAGRAKAFRGPAAQVRGPVVIYGEDVLAEAELLLPASVDADAPGQRPKWVRAMGVFDGHGLMGKEAARLAAERFIEDMRRSTMQTLGALLAGDVGRVRAVEKERFRALDEHLETELRSPTGGTTCSTVQVLAARGKAYVVVSNVGDSPVLLVENRTGRVALLTGRHSWDNPEERQRYIDRCAALGMAPRDVVYGRINCGGMRLEDADGGEEPFRMYLPGTATVCARTRDHLNKQVERRFRNSIGGSQSVRRFVWERRDEGSGAWEVFKALEEHAHGNWGATVLVGREGKIQMSRSLGDAQEKQTAYVWNEPDVAIHELGPGEDWSVIACSDGVADLWYFHEMAEMAAAFFQRRDEGRAALVGGAAAMEADGAGDAQALAQLILDQTMERGERTPGYGIGPRMSANAHLKRPMWDDVCVHCARVVT